MSGVNVTQIMPLGKWLLLSVFLLHAILTRLQLIQDGRSLRLVELQVTLLERV